MPCPPLTNKGGKLYISAEPVDCDLTIYELAVLDYLFVPGVGSIGDTGIEQDIVTYPTTDDGMTPQGKGNATGRAWDVEVLDAPSAGRDILEIASSVNNDDSYATRIEWPNGDVEFSIAQVSSPAYVKGAASGVRVIRYTMIPSFVPIVTNSLPGASNVVVSGEYVKGYTLTATYDYYSPLGLAESGSVYQWYSDGVAIPGADALTYVIDEDYEGAMISFGVIPSDGFSEGNESVSAAGGPVVLFTPELLFENGLYGGLFSTAKRMYNGVQVLFQDAAGTIPVAADGDPVGLILDLSGNGNHRYQTEAGRRAIYHTDGTYEWITPDGIDDFYVTVGNVDMKGSVASSMFVAIQQPENSGAARIYLEASSDSTTTNGATALFQSSGSLPTYRHRGTVTGTAMGSTVAHGTDVVLSGRGSIAAPILAIYQNGTQTGQSSASQGSGTLLNRPVYLMSRGGSSAFVNTPWYGDMLISRFLTTEQMARVNTYFAGLHP